MFNVSGKSKKGFTLAEVLITLSIIGVVAALTIPTLTKKFEKAEWITRYKQTYSILNQVTKLVAIDYGGALVGAWDQSSGEEMYNAYLPHLKVSTICNNGGTPRSECMHSGMRLLNGEEGEVVESDESSDIYVVILTNGAMVSFVKPVFTGSPHYYEMLVDINGVKQPNTFGKDIHVFLVIAKYATLVPYPYYAFLPENFEEIVKSDCPDNLSGATAMGLTCGTRILRGDYGTAY
ncbi:MAG: type II secretion system protein [Candidatus Gastranaerophilales bacterium]|nr:type II secretion system protein [Candidatus Gastranaerophilales bacterium]